MRKCNGKIVLLLILILIESTLIIVKPSSAQTLKPTVPEYSIMVVEHPYNVAPITTIDPYTGKTVTTQEGYRVENRSIELAIKNQPFTSYKNSNGDSILLAYNISLKGHFEDKWKYYPDAYWKIPLISSKDYYTVVSFGSGSAYNESDPNSSHWDVPDSGQIDFRVQALIGYYNETDILYPIRFHDMHFIGEQSDWSKPKTITISTNTTTDPSSSPSPSVPELPLAVAFGVVFWVSAVLVTIVKCKRGAGLGV
jgi:hypothetical protein